MSAFSLTRFTASKPNRLSKAFRLENGHLIKESGGQLFDGIAEQITVDPAGFADLLVSLKPSQALSYGVNGHDKARVVPVGKLPLKPTNPPTIARDRHHFAWPAGAGVMMLDYDPSPEGPILEREQLQECLYGAWPGLRAAPHLWRPSAGGCIYADDGTELKGVTGQRLYVIVHQAADIPRAGMALFNRLWLAGFGRYEISKSGALLLRSIIDAIVFQPERLDFCGGAECGPGLEQHLPPPLVVNAAAAPIDTIITLQDLTPQEAAEVKALQQKAAAELAGVVKSRKDSWIEERVNDALMSIPLERRHEERPRLLDIYRRACEDGRLMADFILELEKHGPVTVGTILDNPNKYHACRTLDPLEPDYNGGRFTGWLNLRTAGRPYLWSHAHGGKRFNLHRALQTVRIIGGELHHMAERCLELLRLDGVIYQRGQSLGRLADDLIQPVCPDWLALHLTRLCRFEKYDKRLKIWEPVDCPPRLAASICAMAGEWSLPVLRAVVSAPFILANGRVVERDGYDAESGLYLNFADAERWRPIPLNPTLEQIKTAVHALWFPFKEFPFTGPVDRGVFMSAILTAIQRAILPTAPGFSTDAPAAGSGKSLLAKCLCALAGVPSPEAMPPIKQGDDGEIRKRLFAACRAGVRVILFDNATGHVESPALCAFLTAEVFSDRILGVSEIGAAPTTAMVLFTGNNLSMVGDLNRRVLRARIDAEVEAPHRRKFALNPVAYVQEHRLDMVRAGLIVLRGYLQANAVPADSMASFEAWNDLIRGATIWLGKLTADENGNLLYSDPAESIDATYDLDPERAQLGAVLEAWYEVFKTKSLTVSEVIREAEASKHVNSALFDALQEVAGARGIISNRYLGQWLASMAERIVNGFRLRRGGRDAHKKAVKWRVESVNVRVTADNCGYSGKPTRENHRNDVLYKGIEKLHADTRTYPQIEPDTTNVDTTNQPPKAKFRRDF